MTTICTEHGLSGIEPQLSNACALKRAGVSRATPRDSLGRRFKQWLERRRDQRDSRDAFKHMLKLDDSLLEDIGVTRAEVLRAAKLPLAENASQVLNESAGRNRADRG